MRASPSRIRTCSVPLAVLALLGAWAVARPRALRAAGPAAPVLETYRVPPGTAPAVVRDLSAAYPPSPERRVAPAGEDAVLVYATPAEQRAIARQLRSGESAGGAGRTSATGTMLVHQLVDPQEKKDEPKKSGGAEKEPPPVTITALGNKLVISSDDREAIREVQQLVRYLTTAPADSANFQVIRLKNANAVDAAKVLDETFNGPRQPAQPQQPQPFGRGFGGRFGLPAPTPTPPRQERVRVVPDPDTNTLLVRASPLDMMTVRRLLASAIDTSSDDNSGAMRTWVIGPLKYAVATEVAQVLTNVYRQHTDNNANLTGLGGGRGGAFRRALAAAAGNQNVGPDGQPRPVTLTIGVDNQTNSIVVACPRSLYDDVKGLVDQLEQASRNSQRTVQVLPVKNIDPALVQQAIDAIQGRPTTRPTAGTTTTSTTPGNTGGSRPGGNPGVFGFGGAGGFRPGGR